MSRNEMDAKDYLNETVKAFQKAGEEWGSLGSRIGGEFERVVKDQMEMAAVLSEVALAAQTEAMKFGQANLNSMGEIINETLASCKVENHAA